MADAGKAARMIPKRVTTVRAAQSARHVALISVSFQNVGGGIDAFPL
jgi:hypothetical protein